ncbi:hypothetical protein [Bradyrhizobium genosp. P]|uniref:hypothetical protein n=1 Tax=Bradyrhizobium genosp. P TaxID=83641 RepID=UPI003CF2C5B7
MAAVSSPHVGALARLSLDGHRFRAIFSHAQGIQKGTGAQHAIMVCACARNIAERLRRVGHNQYHRARHGVLPGALSGPATD